MSVFLKGVDLPEPGMIKVIVLHGDGLVTRSGETIGQAVQLNHPHGPLIDQHDLETRLTTKGAEPHEDHKFDSWIKGIIDSEAIVNESKIWIECED